MARISQAAIDLIIREEVSSEAVYRKKYTRPEWPGVASGVTIGIGYDVGYSTPSRLRADWSGRIPDKMIDALTRACGVTGQAAAGLTKALRSQVVVPWEAAIGNFEDVVLPRWEATVRSKLPNCDQLHPDCFGALVSLAYNRGPSFGNTGDRYREMRAIKALMAAGKFSAIPSQFRSMKRLWPNVKGLQARREREAQLFERGLQKPKARPIPDEPRMPPDVPAPKPIDPEVINKTDDPENTKPAAKSKTIILAIIGFFTMIWEAVEQYASNPRFWIFIAVAAALLYIASERFKRPDIMGWFK